MNVVDSSAWLEYFADGPNARRFSTPLRQTRDLLVPSICLTDVFKVINFKGLEGVRYFPAAPRP